MRFALACWLAVVALLLVGCGGKKSSSSTATTGTTTTAPDNGIASQTPEEIIASMKAAVSQATTLHVVGAGSTSGTSIVLDLKLVKGKGGAGHIALNGLGFDIVRIGQKVYIKATKKFLVRFAGPSAVSLAGRWFTVSASTKSLGSLAQFTNLTALMNQILSAPGTLAKGQTTTVDGQPALAVTDSANGGTLYIATTGPALPLKLVPGKKNTGAIKFTWNEPVTLTAPKHPLSF